MQMLDDGPGPATSEVCRAAWLGLLIAVVLLANACSRSREDERVVQETVPVAQTVVVRETVVVERIVEVTPTPDLSREPVTLQLNLGGEPLSIDPALAGDAAGLDVVESLLPGSDRASTHRATWSPGWPRAWTVSDDGLRWTFTLRDDVSGSTTGPAAA